MHSYPAGFVYIYSLFYYVTGHGENIAMAQALFAGLYLLNLAVVMAVYCSVARVSQLSSPLPQHTCIHTHTHAHTHTHTPLHNPILLNELYIDSAEILTTCRG